MQRWWQPGDTPAGFGPSVVCLGVFDGLHCGHQAVIGRGAAVAAHAGVPLALATFEPPPAAVLRGVAPVRLTMPERFAELAEDLDVDVLCTIAFDEAMARMSPEEFVSGVLVPRLHPVTVLVGANFRFGHRASGDVRLLTELGERYGFTVEALPLRSADGDGAVYSSSRIRQLLAEGNVTVAGQMLGRPHRVAGEVVHGDGRGRQLGYPTANLAQPAELAVPQDGVYAGWLHHDGRAYRSAVSIGTNPTFDGCEHRVEAYALDVDIDLYGDQVAVDFVARLRGSVRFESVPALVAQIDRDVDTVRDLLERLRPARSDTPSVLD